MRFRPVRLPPGVDLRRAIERLADDLPDGAGFVASGIGSLASARLRMADAGTHDIEGPLEIVSISGSICADGAHLHMVVADGRGAVKGGHVQIGCLVRTTAELLIAELRGYRLSRELDARTGYRELVVRRKDSTRKGRAGG
jgi:predicted DNA-binding protein with PD1-like motif